MKEIHFTPKEMAAFLKVTDSTVRTWIRDLHIIPRYKINNERYFSKESYQRIMDHKFKKDDAIIVYEPLRMETVYHVYPSKMNYLEDL